MKFHNLQCLYTNYIKTILYYTIIYYTTLYRYITVCIDLYYTDTLSNTFYKLNEMKKYLNTTNVVAVLVVFLTVICTLVIFEFQKQLQNISALQKLVIEKILSLK